MKDSARALLNGFGTYRPGSISDTDTQETEALALTYRTTPVRTIRVQRWEALPGLEAAWANLLKRCPASSVFQTFHWHVSWWKAFGGPHELFVVLAYMGADLVGIAPMMITRENGHVSQGRSQLRFIGSINNASDYCDFITDADAPKALPALLEHIRAGSTECDRIELSNFPSHSPHRTQTLEYFESRDARIMIEFQSEAPVRILGDRKADMQAANKSSLKRHTKYFEKSGDLRFHQCESEDEILGYLDSFFDQHKSRRAQTGSPSQFFDPAQQVFYKELVRQAFRHGWLRFDVVLFNGAPLAFHFGFEYQRRFIWYKPTFDVEFASKSPGEVLIKFLLEDAIRKELEEFDFTVGSEPFKYRFANRIRSNERIIVFRSLGDYWIYQAIGQGKSMLKKFLKRDEKSKSYAESSQ
ncbi:MAG TPA: GNAT family N-acetyltransferase [Burkholderiales bacterium]|nr:GNAT family N-acetyltransferase [Burkholderiales bacterium]